MQLKQYQLRTLERLEAFLKRARRSNAQEAFVALTSDETRQSRYQEAEGLRDVPYVCLRLPTGGGKTLLSAHSIPHAARHYLDADFPPVLWLVPTNTIRAQTLETLKKSGHPNHEALREAFEGNFAVYDIADFELIRAQDLGAKTIVVVATMAALRVSSTEGRKVYAHTEKLEAHFKGVPLHVEGLETISEGSDAGKIRFSFANLLYLMRPLVLVDEAHNAASALSFEVLGRINPACIVEYTATPAKNSNILYHVSASELKAEEMIKLPIELKEHGTWQEAIEASIETRIMLEERAKNEPDYIRPIVLIQAENKDKEITVDAVIEYLERTCKIDRERIAVVTGNQKELDGIDILSPTCKIEYIVTIQALKEGWDCPFAYIFCSVAKVSSPKDVEQLLGRVLRMPYASRRVVQELNRAYAHVSRTSWRNAVSMLHDRLVDMGFERHEVDYAIEAKPSAPVLPGLLPDVAIAIAKAPDLSALDLAERGQVSLEKRDEGYVLTLSGSIDDTLQRKLSKALEKADREVLINTLGVREAQERKVATASMRGERLEVPGLCLYVQGELELIEPEMFLEASGWNLTKYPVALEVHEFHVVQNAKTYEVDIDGERIRERFLGYGQGIFSGMDASSMWSEFDLVRWLDRELSQSDIFQSVMQEFCRKSVAYLIERRAIALSVLVHARHLLASVLRERIARYRKQALEKGFQATLFGEMSEAIRVSDAYAFGFDEKRYAPKHIYVGSYRFEKHFFPLVGELKEKGEEFECAKALDESLHVKSWVRNLERRSDSSFWLPTSSDLFYPDFVALLGDGRILVVEYKGEPYKSNDDSKEKLSVGMLWETKSEGRGLFLMAVKKDDSGLDVTQQLEKKISDSYM